MLATVVPVHVASSYTGPPPAARPGKETIDKLPHERVRSVTCGDT